MCILLLRRLPGTTACMRATPEVGPITHSSTRALHMVSPPKCPCVVAAPGHSHWVWMVAVAGDISLTAHYPCSHLLVAPRGHSCPTSPPTAPGARCMAHARVHLVPAQPLLPQAWPWEAPVAASLSPLQPRLVRLWVGDTCGLWISKMCDFLVVFGLAFVRPGCGAGTQCSVWISVAGKTPAPE